MLRLINSASWQVASPDGGGASPFNEAMSGYSGEDAAVRYERDTFASGRPRNSTPETSPKKSLGAKGDYLGSVVSYVLHLRLPRAF